MHWRMGEHRMIAAGGLENQPAGDWIAAQRAGHIWYIFEQMSKVQDYSTQNTLTGNDVLEYWELKKLIPS